MVAYSHWACKRLGLKMDPVLRVAGRRREGEAAACRPPPTCRGFPTPYVPRLSYP